MKICLQWKDRRYSGIPSKLPQEQNQMFKECKQNAEVPWIYIVVSANEVLSSYRRSKLSTCFICKASVLPNGLPSKGQSVSWVCKGPRLWVTVTGLRHRWRAQGQGLNALPKRGLTSYPEESTSKTHADSPQEENTFPFVNPPNHCRHYQYFCNRQHSQIPFLVFYCCCYYYYFCFLGLHLQHMEIPKLGIKSVLQLPAYTTATQDLNPICDLYHSSWE